MSKLDFNVKEKIVALSAACFWYWDSFYSFLNSSQVPQLLQDRYPRSSYKKPSIMRNIINDLEATNNEKVIKNIVSGFYKLKISALNQDNINIAKARELLTEFKGLIGNDPIEEEIKRQQSEKRKQDHLKKININKSFQDELQKLNQKFLLLHSHENHQVRGFELENLIAELLRINEFDFIKSYKTDSEQIDGYLKFEGFDYLLEIKWTDGLTSQKDLSIFDGKIRGKAQSTRGIFISMNGFDNNVIIKFSNDSPRIILMTGEDLALVLSGTRSLYDVIYAKVDALVRHGNICYLAREMK